MEHIKAQDGSKRKNSDACTVTEFEFEGEKNINSAVVELNGRYPESGFALNTVCEEIVYVIEGHGQLVNPQARIVMSTGDMLRIKPNENYYFDGNLKLLIATSPAWYPEQYKNKLV